MQKMVIFGETSHKTGNGLIRYRAYEKRFVWPRRGWWGRRSKNRWTKDIMRHLEVLLVIWWRLFTQNLRRFTWEHIFHMWRWDSTQNVVLLSNRRSRVRCCRTQCIHIKSWTKKYIWSNTCFVFPDCVSSSMTLWRHIFPSQDSKVWPWITYLHLLCSAGYSWRNPRKPFTTLEDSRSPKQNIRSF